MSACSRMFTFPWVGGSKRFVAGLGFPGWMYPVHDHDDWMELNNTKLLCVYLGLLYISAANIEMQRWHRTQYPVYVPVNMSYSWTKLWRGHLFTIITTIISFCIKILLQNFKKKKTPLYVFFVLFYFVLSFYQAFILPHSMEKRSYKILDKNKVWSLFGTWGKQNKILKKMSRDIKTYTKAETMIKTCSTIWHNPQSCSHFSVTSS